MHLLSTGKSTILTAFENLETKSICRRGDSESTDFQFCAKTPIFVEVNKKAGIEILRVRENANRAKEIQRVRKIGIESAYCVAGLKQSAEEIGVGLSNGQVSVFNYANSEFVHKYGPETNRKSVLFLDFNASDEYISSVLDSGRINIYGTKTRAKIDTVNIDENSTLARFHPSKRFHLSIASYKGTVTVYDIQSKQKIFQNHDSHTAPCRDLSMSPAVPHTLVSVGYDCLINIFDMRRKTQPLQLRYCHPLSTVALSDCGNFFCVGNLKGELISYDMRSPKVFLVSKKVHDCPVTRIAFVPNDGDAAASFACSDNTTNVDCSNVERQRAAGGDLRNSIPPSTLVSDALTRGRRDSFCDFLDFQANKGLEKMSSRFITRRDSYDCWDALQRKTIVEETRLSIGVLGVSGSNSAVTSANNSVSAATCDSMDAKLNANKCAEAVAEPSTLPLRDRSNNNFTKVLSNKLVQIQEEMHNVSSESDKENPAVELNPDVELMSRLQILPGDRNSTPNRTDRFDPESENREAVFQQKSTAASSIAAADFTHLLAEMNTRFRQLESNLMMEMEANKWHIFSQNFNLWSILNENNETICDALGILLQTDPFVNEFNRLKKENEELKLELKRVAKK